MAAAWRANLRWRWTRPLSLLVPVLVGVVLTGVEALDSAARATGLFLAPLVAVPVFMGAVRGIYFALLPLLARRTFRQTAAYREEWLVEMSAAGIRARAGATDHFEPWSHYVAWQETPRVVMLYQNDNLFQFVPREAVDPATAATFRTLAAGLPRR